jgi:hypothetical protein
MGNQIYFKIAGHVDLDKLKMISTGRSNYPEILKKI